MRPKVLITKHIYQEAVEYLRKRVEVDYHDSAEGFPPAELIERLRDKEGTVSQLTDEFSAEVLAALPKLKVISNVAVGFDNIDVSAASERGILVTNTPEVLTDTTADFAFTLLMAAARRLGEAERFLRAGKWRQWRVDLFCGQDIHHATLGLLGVGRIGRGVARRAGGFEMRVIYHDVQPLDAASEKELNATFVSRDELLAEADFLSVHVPLSESTRHAIGEEEFEKMKPTAILINTARGPVVDEKALAKALAQGKIAGAGLDVFEREPEIEEALLALDNVVLVPHIASASIATRTKMSMMAAENMAAALAGERPPNPVNPNVLD